VYEIIEPENEGDKPQLQINSQNYLHGKTCNIKDLSPNIIWLPPESSGPLYGDM